MDTQEQEHQYSAVHITNTSLIKTQNMMMDCFKLVVEGWFYEKGSLKNCFDD